MLRQSLLLAWCLLYLSCCTHAFNLVLMGRRKGGLRRNLEDQSNKGGKSKGGGANKLNGGLGQEITGVSLPTEGTIKGWEFGKGVQMACANVGGTFYAVQGDCPRCAFDLFKGDLITDGDAWEDVPRVACPTCSTTYGLRTGQHGPPIKRTGLNALVGNLASTATQKDSYKNAKAFTITRDEDGRVYCRDA